MLFIIHPLIQVKFISIRAAHFRRRAATPVNKSLSYGPRGSRTKDRGSMDSS